MGSHLQHSQRTDIGPAASVEQLQIWHWAWPWPARIHSCHHPIVFPLGCPSLQTWQPSPPPPSHPTPACLQTLPRYDPRHPWTLTSVLWVLVHLPSRLLLAMPAGGPRRCPSGVASSAECHGPCLGLRSTRQPQPLPPMPSECSLGVRGLACVLNSCTSVCRAPAGSRAGQTFAFRPRDADLEALCASRSPAPRS